MDLNKLLEEIKERIDIVDFISEYIDLKKTGQNYRAPCPFHSERTPSFFVSPSKKIFHCFGCGKGGDIVTFLMEYESIDFQEALSILAKRAGVEFNYSPKKSTASKEKIYEIYKWANIFYQKNLNKSERAKNYLSNRGINNETIKLFQIGFAKADKDGLYNFLKSKNFDESLIKLSGLVNRDFDFFRDRIIIPIHDITGRVIGFGGRLLGSDGELPKYINSPDTVIFKKGENLFGLWLAKKHIKEKGYVTVVEGYIDVILCHQYGFKNTVAPLGTAVTEEQLRRLKRLTNKLLFIFDGDEAGIGAAQRSLLPAFKIGFIVKIVLLSKKDDPASVLQREGEKALKKHISQAMSPVEFFIKINKSKSLTEKVHSFLNVLAILKDSIYRDELLKELCEKTEISEVTLREQLKQIVSNMKIQKEKGDLKRDEFLKEDEILLRISIFYPEKMQYIFRHLDIEQLNNNLIKKIFHKLRQIYEEKSFVLDKFFNMLDENEKSVVSKLIMKSEIDEASIDQNINDCIKRIVVRSIDKKIKEAANSGDEKNLYELINQKKMLIKEL